MKRNPFIGYFLILIGISMIIFWFVLITKKKTDEGHVQLGFHVATEMVMALGSIVAGIFYIKNRPGGLRATLVALGMLIYSFSSASGFYGQRENLALFVFFLGLLILCLVFLIFLLIDRRGRSHYKKQEIPNRPH